MNIIKTSQQDANALLIKFNHNTLVENNYNLYETIRKDWVINPPDSIKYLIAYNISTKTIAGVYNVDSWFKPEDSTRVRFNIHSNKELDKVFYGEGISPDFAVQNPVLYAKIV
ncbi:MAG: hypothetical protein J6T10_01765 [Methanobrevibacter sp.]|nr:hypothetical protein [Methanobrevibacter sp.]